MRTRIKADRFGVAVRFGAPPSRVRSVMLGSVLLGSAMVGDIVGCSSAAEDGAQQAAAIEGGAFPALVISAGTIADLPLWHLGPAPLRIGEGNAAREYALDVVGMPWRLSDGDIVVPNAQSEIRWYDSTGRFVRTVGRRGKGPGEFEGLWNIQPVEGDTILAVDRQRVSIFDSAGGFVRSTPPPTNVTYTIGVRLLGDRTMLTLRYPPSHMERLTRSDSGVYVDTMALVRTFLDGAEDTIASVKGPWMQVTKFGDGVDVVYAGDPLVVSSDTMIVVAHGDDFELRWLDPAGRTVRLTRVAIPRIPVPRAMVAANEARVTEERKTYEAERGEHVPLTYATHLPMLSRLAVDRLGQVWARRWVPDDATDAEWIVFAPDGQARARIVMPAGFVFADADTDYVLGRFTDPDGVQSVRRYTIDR